MSCYIIGAGVFCGFVQKPTENDFVIAADGGYTVCQKENIVPDYILGDFDSLGHVPQGSNVLQVPVEKDDTDTMLAVKLGLEKGQKEFHIYGGTGGRLDHTLANLQTLLYLKRQGGSGWLHDHQAAYTVVENESVTLSARTAGTLSVFAMDGTAEGVSILGGKYTMEDGTLTGDFPLGVSNHFVGKEITVSVRQGALLVCVSELE